MMLASLAPATRFGAFLGGCGLERKPDVNDWLGEHLDLGQ
jgi:hypothetical protein